MILTVCMSPSVDVTVEVDSLNIGKTNVAKSKSVLFGGKALNVAVGVKRLQGESRVTGVMYQENGRMFEDALTQEGVPFSFVYSQGRVRESYKFIDNRSMMTEVNGVSSPITRETADKVLLKVSELSKNAEVTVLSGGIPRGLDDRYYGELAKAVDSKSLKIVDAHGLRLFSAMGVGADLIKPNLEELENTIGKQITSKEDMLSACYELLNRGAKRVLLSLGKQGAVITDGTRNYYCKSIQVAVNSTVGAGDGMVAAASLRLKEDAPLSEILRSSVAAGTATVMTVGQVSFTKEKYEEVLSTLRVIEI